MRRQRLINWSKPDDNLLTSLRKADVTFEKIQPVLSQWRSIEALKSRIWKLDHPESYANKVAQQTISNKNRLYREKHGTVHGFHNAEWPETARFGPVQFRPKVQQ